MFNPMPKPVKALKKDLHTFAKAMSKLAKRKPIKKVSKATSKNMGEYSRLKKEFIKDKTCPIYPHLKVTDIHHMKGRAGTLLLDTNFWLAVSRKAHIRIELNPKWARDQGYSLPRNGSVKEILSRNESEHESKEMAQYLSGLPPTMIE